MHIIWDDMNNKIDNFICPRDLPVAPKIDNSELKTLRDRSTNVKFLSKNDPLIPTIRVLIDNKYSCGI